MEQLVQFFTENARKKYDECMIDLTQRRRNKYNLFLKREEPDAIVPTGDLIALQPGRMIRAALYLSVLAALLLICLMAPVSAQHVTFDGKLKVKQTVNAGTADSLVVLRADGELARRLVSGLPGNTGGWTNLANAVYTLNRVGIGTGTPKAFTTLAGTYGNPAIPGTTSNGILRIAPTYNDGLDIGKKINDTYDAWLQAGFNGTSPDPISFQPMGGNVGIGLLSPSARLDVNGDMKVAGIVTVAGLPSLPQDAAAKLYLDNNFVKKPLTPVAGQMLYYNGSTWIALPPGMNGQVLKVQSNIPTWTMQPCDFSIGQFYKGGYIFYIDNTGCHGLIAAAADISPGPWGCYGATIGGTSTAFGTGQSNTTAIVNGCNNPYFAAKSCNDLVYGGYDDWFLPSRDELALVRSNLAAIGIGNFYTGSADVYWSSSESNSYDGWQVFFSDGYQNTWNKNEYRRIRPIRAF